MRILAVGFCLLFCFVPLAPAQEKSPEKAVPAVKKKFELAITRKEARTRWGEPVECRYTFDPEQCTAPDEYDWGKRKALGFLYDVYRRKTDNNTYEVQVKFSMDRTKSERHPEIRVISVIFEAQQPTTVLPMLHDIPEALELCKSGCGMYGDNIGGTPEVVVYPRHASLLQRRLAERMSNHWERMPLWSRDEGWDWVQAFRLRLEAKPSDQYRKAQDIDWFRRPVKEAIFNVDAPRGNLKFDRIYRRRLGHKLIDLGTFDPKSSKETGDK